MGLVLIQRADMAVSVAFGSLDEDRVRDVLDLALATIDRHG